MGYTPRNEKCRTCGRTFLKKAPKSVRCPKCRKIQREIENRARAVKRYHERIAQGKSVRKPKKDMDRCDVRHCGSCMYRGKDTNLGNESGVFCNYISVTEKSRLSICPAGACTVYRKGKPKKSTEQIALQ